MALRVKGRIKLGVKVPLRLNSSLTVNKEAIQKQLDSAVYDYIAANKPYRPKSLEKVIQTGYSALVTAASKVVNTIHSAVNLKAANIPAEIEKLNRFLVPIERKELINWAKSQGLYHAPTLLEKTQADQFRINGNNQQTLIVPGSPEVQKYMTITPQENWLNYFQRLETHAAYFGSTAYEFKGFTESVKSDGSSTLVAVTEQRLVVGEKTKTEEIATYMESLGFVRERNKAFIEQGITDAKWDRFHDPKTGIIVYNLSESNVLKESNGSYAVLDPLFDFSRLNEDDEKRDGGAKDSKGLANENQHYTIGDR